MAPDSYEDAVTLGMALSEAKTERDLTQSEIADEIGVHQSRVSKWMRDVESPGPENFEAIAAFLDVPVENVAVLVHRGRKASALEAWKAEVEDRITKIEEGLARLARQRKGGTR